MSQEQELKKLMGLVDEYGNAVEEGARCINGGPSSENEAYQAIENRLRTILAELNSTREDAERYRWLRAQPNDCTAPRIDICHWTRDEDDSVNNGEGLRFEEADKAIDSARKG